MKEITDNHNNNSLYYRIKIRFLELMIRICLNWIFIKKIIGDPTNNKLWV